MTRECGLDGAQGRPAAVRCADRDRAASNRFSGRRRSSDGGPVRDRAGAQRPVDVDVEQVSHLFEQGDLLGVVRLILPPPDATDGHTEVPRELPLGHAVLVLQLGEGGGRNGDECHSANAGGHLPVMNEPEPDLRDDESDEHPRHTVQQWLREHWRDWWWEVVLQTPDQVRVELVQFHAGRPVNGRVLDLRIAPAELTVAGATVYRRHRREGRSVAQAHAIAVAVTE